ncbi:MULTISPECIES: hypothetical protein [unclassified Exiguobacterium]|uniref:hypothetical protein n=1 Tax=unclassified Exiguobacterium TaxID=2644629 RepID=UPI000B592936|nr:MULTISPECIES: hypothetical protein [unclassified Exiguobacterium]ASI35492.1 hypothetical protein A0126_07935 [Exiguobacterium sp. N4-1P]ASI37501.1 hypothetical protein A0126_18200 [Exiguobacterium sp. N4-1P]
MERSILIALEKHLYVMHHDLDGLARLITKKFVHLSQVAASVEHFRRMSFDIYKSRESLAQISPQVLYETALDYEDWLEEEFDQIPPSWMLSRDEELALDQLWWFEFFRIQAELEEWLSLYLIRRIREDIRYVPPVIEKNAYALSDDARHVFWRLLQRSVAKPSSKIKANQLSCRMGIAEIARCARLNEERTEQAIDELTARGIISIVEENEKMKLHVRLQVI